MNRLATVSKYLKLQRGSASNTSSTRMLTDSAGPQQAQQGASGAMNGHIHPRIRVVARHGTAPAPGLMNAQKCSASSAPLRVARSGDVPLDERSSFCCLVPRCLRESSRQTSAPRDRLSEWHDDLCTQQCSTLFNVGCNDAPPHELLSGFLTAVCSL